MKENDGTVQVTEDQQQQPQQPELEQPAGVSSETEDLAEDLGIDLTREADGLLHMSAEAPVMGKEYNWPQVMVSGLPEPVAVRLLPAQSGEEQTSIYLAGRLIAFEGECVIGQLSSESGGQVSRTLTLPDNWDYAEGPSRHAAAVPVSSALEPLAFEILADRIGRKSQIILDGEPVVWPSKVTLEIPARGLSQLTLQGVWVQGVSKGEAVTRLIVNAIGKRDRMLSSEADTQTILDLLAARTAEPGSDLVQGSCVVPTEHGDRLATFIMALTPGPGPLTGPVGQPTELTPSPEGPDLPALAEVTTDTLSTYELGRVGYEGYAAHTQGKTFDGRNMPTWEETGEHTQGAWEAASRAIVQHHEALKAQASAQAAETLQEGEDQ